MLPSRGGDAGSNPAGCIMVKDAKNTRLTQYEDIKDAVIANAVKDVPVLKKAKDKEKNSSLSQF